MALFKLNMTQMIRKKGSKFIRESFENARETSGDFPPTVLPTQKIKDQISQRKFESS